MPDAADAATDRTFQNAPVAATELVADADAERANVVHAMPDEETDDVTEAAAARLLAAVTVPATAVDDDADAADDRANVVQNEPTVAMADVPDAAADRWCVVIVNSCSWIQARITSDETPSVGLYVCVAVDVTTLACEATVMPPAVVPTSVVCIVDHEPFVVSLSAVTVCPVPCSLNRPPRTTSPLAIDPVVTVGDAVADPVLTPPVT